MNLHQNSAVTPKAFIRNATRAQKLYLTIAIVTTIIMVPFAIYTNINLAHSPYSQSNRDSLIQGNAIANILALLSLGCLYYAWRLYRKHTKDFRNPSDLPIFWTYPDGSFFMLAHSAVVYYDAYPPKQVIRPVFEGIAWSIDEVKGIIEDALKSELSVFSFLPKLKFKTTTNFVPPYIPLLSNNYKLTVVFCERSSCSFLIVAVEAGEETSTICIPVSPDARFEEINFNRVRDFFRVKAYYKTQFFHFDKAKMADIAHHTSENRNER